MSSTPESTDLNVQAPSPAAATPPAAAQNPPVAATQATQATQPTAPTAPSQPVAAAPPPVANRPEFLPAYEMPQHTEENKDGKTVYRFAPTGHEAFDKILTILGEQGISPDSAAAKAAINEGKFDLLKLDLIEKGYENADIVVETGKIIFKEVRDKEDAYVHHMEKIAGGKLELQNLINNQVYMPANDWERVLELLQSYDPVYGAAALALLQQASQNQYDSFRENNQGAPAFSPQKPTHADLVKYLKDQMKANPSYKPHLDKQYIAMKQAAHQ